MSSIVEQQDIGTSRVKPTEVKPAGFTLRRKIISGFGGLMLLMTFCILFTLYKLSTIEKSAISVIEHQQPTAILIVTLSEDLNLAVSLLNEYMVSGKEGNDFALIRDNPRIGSIVGQN